MFSSPRRETTRAWPLVLLVAGFAAVTGTFRLRAFDAFWHLASGRWIVEHQRIPAADPFRFTSEAYPWIDHGWLFQVAAHLVERVGGLTGLSVVRTLVVVGLALLLWRELGRSRLPAAAALIVVVALLGARPRFMLRPELASLAGLTVLLLLLAGLRRSRGILIPAWLVGLVVVWANLHPGVLIAPPLAAVFLLGTRLPGGAGPGRGGSAPPGWGLVVGVPVVMALAILANPAGARLFAVPFHIADALRGLPVTNPEWQTAWAAPQPFFWVGVAVLGAWVAYGAWRARRVDPATGLVALCLLALAVSGVRHQGLFFLGAAFLAGEVLGDLSRRSPAAATARPLTIAAVAACLLAAAWCVATPVQGPLRARQGPYVFGWGLEPGRFPEQAVDRLADWPEVERPYNDVAFGGYLIWRRFPDHRVFIDGRNEVDPDLLREVARARDDSREWNALLERHAVDGALVRYDERPRPVVLPTEGSVVRELRTTHRLLFPASRFALVHWDDVAMLFVRRSPQLEDRLAGVEYRVVHPEDRPYVIETARHDPRFRTAALAELERKLAEDPHCRRARELREALRSGG